jgi:hypothetical protein
MSEPREKLKLNPLNRPVVGKEAREVAAEIRADEQAARVRDYGPEDAATYDQRVRDGAESSYDRMLAEAGKFRRKEKSERPER